MIEMYSSVDVIFDERSRHKYCTDIEMKLWKNFQNQYFIGEDNKNLELENSVRSEQSVFDNLDNSENAHKSVKVKSCLKSLTHW